MLTYITRSSRAEWISRGRRPTLRPPAAPDNLDKPSLQPDAWTSSGAAVRGVEVETAARVAVPNLARPLIARGAAIGMAGRVRVGACNDDCSPRARPGLSGRWLHEKRNVLRRGLSRATDILLPLTAAAAAMALVAPATGLSERADLVLAALVLFTSRGVRRAQLLGLCRRGALFGIGLGLVRAASPGACRGRAAGRSPNGDPRRSLSDATGHQERLHPHAERARTPGRRRWPRRTSRGRTARQRRRGARRRRRAGRPLCARRGRGGGSHAGPRRDRLRDGQTWCPRYTSRRSAATSRSWPAGARTIPTRSTTFWPSRGLQGRARGARTHGQRGDEARRPARDRARDPRRRAPARLHRPQRVQPSRRRIGGRGTVADPAAASGVARCERGRAHEPAAPLEAMH
jgi:hypothetical protein